MGKLERGVSWISLFIAIAPMLGFMGTVIGMIQAFDKIEAAGGLPWIPVYRTKHINNNLNPK